MGLIGSTLEPPSRAEAEAFFAAWTAALPDRLVWFEAQVAADSGPVLDGSPASLEPLLAFVLDRIADLRPVDPAPLWFRQVHRDVGWSSYGAALVVGLIAYVASIYRRLLGDRAEWVLNVDERDADFLQPVMRDGVIPPPWTVVATIEVVRSGRGDLGRLRGIVESVTAVREALGWSASGSPTSVELTPVEEFSEWDVQVEVAEDLVEVVGFEAYASLEERFGSVPGVVAAMFEDREVCLLKLAAGADRDAVRRGLEAVLAELVPQ